MGNDIPLVLPDVDDYIVYFDFGVIEYCESFLTYVCFALWGYISLYVLYSYASTDTDGSKVPRVKAGAEARVTFAVCDSLGQLIKASSAANSPMAPFEYCQVDTIEFESYAKIALHFTAK